MKRFLGVLFAWIGALALADTPAPVHRVATDGERAAETLIQLERAWADAELAGDREKIRQILADDWTGVTSEGRKLTKEQLLATIKNGQTKAMSVKLGPMDVKVLGDVAVVQGTEVETSTKNGHSSGEEMWTDVFANRDGKWVAVRSQSAMVVAETAWKSRFPI